MKRASIALTALVLVALTGCAGTVETAPSEPVEVVESAPVETVAPDVTEEPTPTVEPGPMTVTPPPVPDIDPVEEMQGEWWQFVGESMSNKGYGYPELVDARALGQYICDQARAGVAPEDIHAFDGLKPGDEIVNTWIVGYTLMDNYSLSESQIAAGETLPDHCGVLFP